MEKKISTLLPALCLFAATPTAVYAQDAGDFQLVQEKCDNPENTPRPVFPVPSERQLKWNETEFYAFFHYGMNTYTNLEWGNGDEDVNRFAPTAVPNPKQWLEAAKSAGMQGGIAVIKHHDGFCLWPTKTTNHNAHSSNNANAKKTNIPQDFSKAAQELGMKYGFYISPWDRNSQYWGEKDDQGNYTSTYTNDVFLKQCAEAASYGSDQFEMWFDGARGGSGYYGGKRGNRDIPNADYYYDIPNLRDSIHKVCPNIILWGVGGEARWIGNEAGWAGETNWAMGGGEYGNENGWRWFPGESDAKATTRGWFWHEGEGIHSTERLFQMYLETVGRNATLILNLPPDKSGSLPEQTVNRMKELGKMLTDRLGNDLALTANVEASETRSNGATVKYEANNVKDNKKETYWATNDGVTSATLTFTWDQPQTIHYVSMMEFIRLGQRVKSFTIETSEDGTNFTKRGGDIKTTTIGYKRIIPLNGSTSNSYDAGVRAKVVKITINDAKACPLLHTVSIY